MRSFSASPANFQYLTRIHPALLGFADDVCGFLAPLSTYLMTLALLAIGAIGAWEHLRDAAAREPSDKDAWSLANRSARAFAISQFDLRDKTETYEVFRHPGGGRKDLLRWRDADRKPVAELEIYRPGDELTQASLVIADIAGKMDPDGMRELEAAGVIDSKFGTVTLLRLIGGRKPRDACLGFIKRVDEPNLRISGWSCQSSDQREDRPAQRAAISCMLNRLMLLSAGNDPKLAELFARAELRRSDCTASAAPALSADWLTGTGNPQLRGAL